MKANNLKEILKVKGFLENDFIFYGEDVAKIKNYSSKEKIGKLILVTSTSPTKYGEGKTTLAISLSDALNKLGHKSCVILREPSLGPVFGSKGGATGGGRATVLPELAINLHFTGDIHAITTANNLLSAIIDNHIFQGNALGINPEEIMHERCMDLNDRSLRTLEINGYKAHFNISTASEFMAILCLSLSDEDLRERIDRILVGYTYDEKEVFVKDLACTNALLLLLKEAIKPNVVKTLEDNLALIHGGPFANIAHGTNSIISTYYGISHFDYTVLEAGFGSDMGALKFYDIVARKNKKLIPDVVVLNTTIQSLKHNGDGLLEKGIENLLFHMENMKKFTDKLLVVLNKHASDLEEEIFFVSNFVKQRNIGFQVSSGYLDGSDGSILAAQDVIKLASLENKEFSYAYQEEESLEEKIKKFCSFYYGAKEILYTDEALKKLELISKSEFKNLPICVAKTQYSITDDVKKLGFPKDFTMTVRDIKLFSGAGFITVYFGNILTMPGLTRDANYMHM